MIKKRTAIPKQTREAILREFNHRCAICGTNNPQIHHIDENPSNNSNENLLPLCPNCHLLDRHDPTSPIVSMKLWLFRHYKDPLILSPQFEPLYRRFEFLLNLDELSFDVNKSKECSEELVQFISELEMGSFYANKISQLTKKPKHARVYQMGTPDSILHKLAKEEHIEYFEILKNAVTPTIELLIELLRYQPWVWQPNTKK